MTEYIIRWDGIAKQLAELKNSTPMYLWSKRIRAERLREPIVRCKDCRECSYEPLYDTYLCNYWSGAGSGMRHMVKAYGFCAWAEPREGSE